MDISCAFPTTMETAEHVKIAEDLGYGRAWLFDTPQQSPDVWMILALAAAKTERPWRAHSIVTSPNGERCSHRRA
jgi:5,10-methylenetetrahydromethanopterin reductase